MMAIHRFAAALAVAALLALATNASLAKDASDAQAEPEIVAQDWSFNGPFGTFDQGQLQRGYKVYREVCSNCHSMRLLSYRNLAEPNGPELSPAAVEALAAEAEVTDGPNDKGEMFKRPGRPSDPFRSPFPNPEAARAANNGALPPDLSVIAKAREGGPDYIHALLTGYHAAPAGFPLTQGMQYNTAFPGHQIAMPPPLSDGVVTYTDGTKPTLDNYAKDVSAFLMWTAEPKLEERKETGFKVMIFLIVLAAMLYFTKRRVWSNVAH